MAKSFMLEFREFLSANNISYSVSENLVYIDSFRICAELVHLGDSVFPHYTLETGYKVIIIYEDLWFSKGEIVRGRLLASFGRKSSIFARNCKVRKIDKSTAGNFLDANHLLGRVNAKFYYALTDKNVTIVAVAAFSAPRPMKRGEEVLNSYEWVRYASLSGMRIAGGMGKLLEHFIRTHSPQEIMSYADKEWSDGDAYKKLGFELVSESDPIDFIVDTKDFKRYSIKKLRRENVTLNPEPGINNYKILRTRGNLKFLKRSSLR